MSEVVKRPIISPKEECHRHARLEAAQIFPKRSRLLRSSGIDLVDFVQYDRMVHDLLQEPWRNLRMIGEFQTDGVMASPDGH